MHMEGREGETFEASINVEPRGLQKITLPETWTPEAGGFIVADVGDERGWWFAGHDRDIPYPSPDYDTELKREGDTLTLTVTARTLLRDLCLLTDHLETKAQTSPQMVHLLPGESVAFTITGAPELTQSMLSDPAILRSIGSTIREIATSSTS